MKPVLRSLSALAAFVLIGCGAEQPRPAAAPPAAPAMPPLAQVADGDVAAALREALGGDWEGRYFDAAIDLNGDGQHEVVAYPAGPMICGTGGCPLFVFTPAPDGYRLVARVSVVQPPIRVSPGSTNGWRNLVVGIGGGGIPAGDSELKFDGSSYPPNATVEPAEPVTDLEGAEILIAQFESYLDGKPLPAGPT